MQVKTFGWHLGHWQWNHENTFAVFSKILDVPIKMLEIGEATFVKPLYPELIHFPYMWHDLNISSFSFLQRFQEQLGQKPISRSPILLSFSTVKRGEILVKDLAHRLWLHTELTPLISEGSHSRWLSLFPFMCLLNLLQYIDLVECKSQFNRFL